MVSLALAALFFIAVHLGISGTTARDTLIARLGPQAYLAAFSTVSVIGLVWLVLAYRGAPYQPTWGMLEGWKPAALVLMLPAFLLVVIGLATPSPTAVAQEQRVSQPERGILRVTRHPFLMGVGLWALVHLVGNGDVASLLLFGALFIVSAAGPASIDAKRRRALGSAWDDFASRTSILPFAAIIAGRNRLAVDEFGLWQPLLGIVAYALLLGGHAHIVGVSPFFV